MATRSDDAIRRRIDSFRRIGLGCSDDPCDSIVELKGFRAGALIDTGSTTTGITPRVAKALNLVGRGKRPLGFAQGEGQAERYLFRIGIDPPSDGPSFPFVFEDVIGFELKDSFHWDALIGMDILSQCHLELDRRVRCVLEFG